MSGNPVRVEQVVDVDSFSVVVSLNPALILPALARVMRGNSQKLMLIRHLPLTHPAHQQARTEMLALLGDVLSVTLTQAQADTFGADLWEATVMPEQCRVCEAFEVVKVDGFGYCHAHARALDASREQVSK